MKSNIHLTNVIRELKKQSAKEKVAIWKAVARYLEHPVRRKREVNIAKINECTKDKETVIIPGKVLGNGQLDHNVTVAAFQFSETANQKLKNKLTILELIKENPKGKNVMILG